MVHYYPNDTNRSLKSDSETDDVGNDPDPGLEIVEKNRKDRAKRAADYTKDELDKVLKRVDNVEKKT
jgi:hypothetical protein